MKNIYKLISAFTILVLFTACNGTKMCVAPQADLPAYYDGGFRDSLSMADLEWWQFYGDSTLCGFIRKALDNNKDILMASKRVEESRLLLSSGKKDMLPQISANIYANHESNDYDGNNASVDPELGVKFTMSWEADLWKRLSWNNRKNEAQYIASIEDKRAMDMIVVAEVAETYFRLLALDSELDIVRQTLVTRGESLHQAKIRFEGGLTSEMVYRQAQVEYTSTASLIPALEEKIALMENSLLLLMGEPAGQKIERQKTMLTEVVVGQRKIGVPSDLLTRRPDLRAAEMRLRASLADVGITYADRFPRFTINLTGGVENDRLANLIRSPFSYVIGALTGPVFDFGKRKKKYEASIAAYDRARIGYEKSVLTAFKEVNDAKISYNSARETAQLKTELKNAAMEYVKLAKIQYAGGTSLYLDVLDAQRRYFDAQIALSNTVRDEYLSLVRLYKSLGGGCSLSALSRESSPSSL